MLYNFYYLSIHMIFKDIEMYLNLLTLCPSKYLRLEWQRKESTQQIQFSSKLGKPGYSKDSVAAQTDVQMSSEKMNELWRQWWFPGDENNHLIDLISFIHYTYFYIFITTGWLHCDGLNFKKSWDVINNGGYEWRCHTHNWGCFSHSA